MSPNAPCEVHRPPVSLSAVTRVLLTCFGLLASSAASALTFEVNSKADTSDSLAGNGFCSTGAVVEVEPGQFEPECTLRAAIEEANGFFGADTITFSSSFPLVVNTTLFSPLSPLPSITSSLTIDGYSMPTYDLAEPFSTPVIQLQGGSIGSSSNGLFVILGTGEAVTIRGLAIINFDGPGIQVAINGDNASFVLEGSHIGLNRGVFSSGNAGTGVSVIVDQDSDPTLVRIGQNCVSVDSCSGKGNVIADSDGDGILVAGPPPSQVEIHGNRIGTDPLGAFTQIPFGGPTPNQGWGISLLGVDVHMTGNLVSGNVEGGIECTVATGRIRGNQVGTNFSGSSALPNEGPGIDVSGDFEVGGRLPGEGNLISGNLGAGVVSWGTNEIVGNTIGLTSSEATALGNGSYGIHQTGVNETLIEANTIGANADTAIRAEGQFHTLLENRIGTNALGENLGNPSVPGIEILGHSMQVGEAEKGNTIGFHATGIEQGAGFFSSIFEGNYIGIDSSGRDIGNTEHGLLMAGISNRVGAQDGRQTGAGNRIGNNGLDGIRATVASQDNWITGNWIGTDLSGTDMGNGADGIAIEGTDTRVGSDLRSGPLGLISGAGNTIAWSGGDGISVSTAANEIMMVGNDFAGNADQLIDLGADGVTPNDSGDADLGPNGLLNSPELDPLLTEVNLATADLDVTYRVDTTTVSHVYPLFVHFHMQTDPSDPATWVYLGYDTYEAASATLPKSITLTFPALPPVLAEVYAMTTDSAAIPSTSEMSASVTVPEPSGALGLLFGGAAIALGGRVRRRSR